MISLAPKDFPCYERSLKALAFQIENVGFLKVENLIYDF